MKKILTLMLVCLIGLTAMAGKKHTVTVVSADQNLQFTISLNGAEKLKAPAKKVNLTNMRGNKDYKVIVHFDNIKIMHPFAELTLTNVSEDLELVAFIEGQQAYLVTRADYDAIQKAKKEKSKAKPCGRSCGHSCGHHGNNAAQCGSNHQDCGHNQPSKAPEQGKNVEKR